MTEYCHAIHHILIECGCAKESFVCVKSLWAELSLKKLKLNRGDQGLGEDCVGGEIPPPLALSPWVAQKKPENHQRLRTLQTPVTVRDMADILCSASKDGLKMSHPLG